MARRFVAAGLLTLSTACSGATWLASTAIFPTDRGPVSMAGAPPTRDTSWQSGVLCGVGSTGCRATTSWTLTYTAGLDTGIDTLQVQYLASDRIGGVRILFADSLSVRSATAWLEAHLNRKPTHSWPDSAEWLDSRYQLQLGPQFSGTRIVAFLYQRDGHQYRPPMSTAGERWEICTRVNVAMCTHRQ